LKGNSNILIPVAISVVVIGLLALLIYGQEERYNWNTTFAQDGENPYDLSLFKKTIAASYEEKNYNELKNLYTDSTFIPSQNGLVVYVDPYFGLDSVEISKLLESAANGNRVFIATFEPTYLLSILSPECENDSMGSVYYKRSKNIDLKLENRPNECEISYVVRKDKERYSWTYFDLEGCDSVNVMGSLTSIGETFPNFIKLDHGEGSLYLFSNPLVFTNYHFRNQAVFEYTQAILSLIPHSKMFYLHPDYYDPSIYEPPVSESPLRFILSNPPLKWAWYLILAITVLYVLNTVRRSQKSIPVFTLPENETAAYLDVVYRLYQTEGHHKDIIGVQEKLLKRHLRNKYRLNFNYRDESTFDEASTRLQMPREYIKGTFAKLDRAKNNSTLSDEEFKEIIENIKEFYQKCP